MAEIAGGADLHVHTTASDGNSSVTERVKQANVRDLNTIAITDHDTISDRLTEPVTVIDGVTVVTGVEIRADLQDTKVEILGYFIDPGTDALGEVLTQARTYREERNQELVENLSVETGLDLAYEALAGEVDGNLSRPHLAETLVEYGIVDSVGMAFDEYLGEGGAAYTPMERVPHEDVLAAIHEAGGIASLAHPGRIRMQSAHVREMAQTLVDAGLDAIEVWYPYAESGPDRYADFGIRDAEQLAGELDLFQTGGSDCHGPNSGKFRLGKVRTPQSNLHNLWEFTAERQPCINGFAP